MANIFSDLLAGFTDNSQSQQQTSNDQQNTQIAQSAALPFQLGKNASAGAYNSPAQTPSSPPPQAQQPGASSQAAPIPDTLSTQQSPPPQQSTSPVGRNAAGVPLANPVAPGNPGAMSPTATPFQQSNPAQDFLNSGRGQLLTLMGSPVAAQDRITAQKINQQNAVFQQQWQKDQFDRAQQQRTYDQQQLGQQLISGQDAQGNPVDRADAAARFAQTYPDQFGEFVQKNGGAFANQAEGFQTVATELGKASSNVAKGFDPTVALNAAKQAIIAKHPEMASFEKDLTPQNFVQMSGIAQQISAAGFSSRQTANQTSAKAGQPNTSAPQDVFNPTGDNVPWQDPSTGQTYQALKLQDPNNPNRIRYDLSAYKNGAQTGIDRGEVNNQQAEYNTARTKFAQTTAAYNNTRDLLKGNIDGPTGTAAAMGFAKLITGKDTVSPEEAQNAIGGLGVGGNIQSVFNRATQGSGLTASQTSDMRKLLDKYYGSQIDAFKPVLDQKLSYAGRYGVDPHQVVSDFDDWQKFTRPGQSKPTNEFTQSYSDAAVSRRQRLQSLPDLYDPNQGRFDAQGAAGKKSFEPTPQPAPQGANQPPAAQTPQSPGTPPPVAPVTQTPQSPGSPPAAGLPARPGGPGGSTPPQPGGATPGGPAAPPQPQPASAQAAPRKPVQSAFGDSLADGFRGGTGIPGQQGNYTMPGATMGGDNSTKVLARLRDGNQVPMTDSAGRPSLSGQRVLLSTGLTNDLAQGMSPKKSEQNIEAQIHEIQARGGQVVLTGVGPKYEAGNDTLRTIAQRASTYGHTVEFADWNKAAVKSPDGMHPDPTGLRNLVNSGTTPDTPSPEHATLPVASPHEQAMANMGISEHYTTNVDAIESPNGNAASSPGHSASGYHQFIEPTWRSYAAKVPGASQYKEAYMAPKPVQDAVFQAFTQDNVNYLKAHQIPVNDATAYMAHQQGPVGATALMTAPSNAIAAQVVKVPNARANWPFFYTSNPSQPGARPFTVAESRQYFEKRMSTPSGTPASFSQTTPQTSPGPTTPRAPLGQTGVWQANPGGNTPPTPGVRPTSSGASQPSPIMPGTPSAPGTPPNTTQTPQQPQAAPPTPAVGSIGQQTQSYAQQYGLPTSAIQAAMNTPQNGAAEYAQRIAQTYGLTRNQIGQLTKFMQEHPSQQNQAAPIPNAAEMSQVAQQTAQPPQQTNQVPPGETYSRHGQPTPGIGAPAPPPNPAVEHYHRGAPATPMQTERAEAVGEGAVRGASMGAIQGNPEVAKRHPIASTAGEAVGTLATIEAGGAGLKAATALPKAAAGVASAFGYGTARGGIEAGQKGESVPLGMAEGAGSTAAGVALGAAGGALVGAAVKGISQVLGVASRTGNAILNDIATSTGRKPAEVAQGVIDGDPAVLAQLKEHDVNPAAARRVALAENTGVPITKNQATKTGDQVATQKMQAQQQAGAQTAAQGFQNEQLPPGISGHPAGPTDTLNPSGADIDQPRANALAIERGKQLGPALNSGKLNAQSLPELDPQAQAAFDKAKTLYAAVDKKVGAKGSATGSNMLQEPTTGETTAVADRVKSDMLKNDNIDPTKGSGDAAAPYISQLENAGKAFDNAAGNGEKPQSMFSTLSNMRTKVQQQARDLANNDNRGTDYHSLMSLSNSLETEWDRQAAQLGRSGQGRQANGQFWGNVSNLRKQAQAQWSEGMGRTARAPDVIDNLKALSNADPTAQNNAAGLLFKGMNDPDKSSKIGRTLMDPAIMPPSGQVAAKALYLKTHLADPTSGQWKTGSDLAAGLAKIAKGGQYENATRAFFGDDGVNKLSQFKEAMDNVRGKSIVQTKAEARGESVSDIREADIAAQGIIEGVKNLSGATGKAAGIGWIPGVSIGVLYGAIKRARELGPTNKAYTFEKLLADAQKGGGMISKSALAGAKVGATQGQNVTAGVKAGVPVAGQALNQLNPISSAAAQEVPPVRPFRR